jgi:hypothetical protein
MRSLKDRFEEKFTIGDGCWEWQGCLGSGYGRIGRGGRGKGVEYAHRVSYMLYVGDIPDNMEVCHKCDNPKCVRPDHLFLGTVKDNMQDCSRKGRTHRGEKVEHAKFTEEDIRRMRSLRQDGWSANRLANEFRSNVPYISSILRGERWGWLS